MEQGLAALGIEDIEAAAREAAREAAAAAATAGAGSAGGGDAGGGSNVDTLTAEQIDALLMRHDQVSLPKNQVWSLTQFYSVDFSKSRISVKSAFSTNAQSRFASAVFDSILGPSGLA